MVDAYSQLKNITDEVYAGKRSRYGYDVLSVLNYWGIKERSKDGVLTQVNISYPTTQRGSIVVGLRYLKKDKTFSEDLFLFEKGKEITPYYKASLEKLFPEYKGTHKLVAETQSKNTSKFASLIMRKG